MCQVEEADGTQDEEHENEFFQFEFGHCAASEDTSPEDTKHFWEMGKPENPRSQSRDH